MTSLRPESNPFEYLTGVSNRRNRMRLMWQSVQHWLRSGHLEHDAETFEMRDRYMYDYSWLCDQCRVYLEEKEGGRIIVPFKDHEMWLTVLDESIGERQTGTVRDVVRRRAASERVMFVTVPIFTGRLVALSTGPLLPESELVPQDDHVHVVFDLVMGSRWKFDDGAGISSSRGFLPPARKYEYFEAYTKGPSDRCWHLHGTREEAEECASILNVEDAEGRRWYTRGTSRWHRIGSVAVIGRKLEKLADECGIRTHRGREGVFLVFESLLWTDPRMKRFLDRAGWTPPHPGFVPPPIEVEFRVASKRGLVTAKSVPWNPVRGVS